MDTRARVGIQVGFIAALVTAWRVSAIVQPSTVIDIDPDLRVPLAVLGMLFLGCGIYTYLRVRNESSKALSVYCFGSAVHWGGSIAAPGDAAVILLAVYVVLSALADGALMHFALVFPRPLVRSPRAKASAYIPASIGIVLVPFSALVSPTTFTTMAGATLLLASTVSIVAGLVIIGQYLRLGPAERRLFGLDAVVFVGLGSTAIGLLGSSGLLPGRPDLWNLLLGILPFTLTAAVTRGASTVDA